MIGDRYGRSLQSMNVGYIAPHALSVVGAPWCPVRPVRPRMPPHAPTCPRMPPHARSCPVMPGGARSCPEMSVCYAAPCLAGLEKTSYLRGIEIRSVGRSLHEPPSYGAYGHRTPCPFAYIRIHRQRTERPYGGISEPVTVWQGQISCRAQKDVPRGKPNPAIRCARA